MEIVLIILPELILNLLWVDNITLLTVLFNITCTNWAFFKNIFWVNQSLHPKGCKPSVILRPWEYLCIRDAGCRSSKITIFYFHFVINLARFGKKKCCFLCLLFNVIYSYFFICWLDFFLNIRFSNRSNSILRIKLSLSPHVIWSFSEVRIACFTWNTFLCLNCHFTNFSSLKLYINDLQN